MKDVTLRAEERHDDLYAGIDLINGKLERQVRKYKTRVNRKNRNRGEQEAFASLPQESEAEEIQNDDNESDIEIIRSKNFSLKPMDSEEAVLQMELIEHGFYMFRNIDSDEISIVYKREDGGYGLIEHE